MVSASLLKSCRPFISDIAHCDINDRFLLIEAAPDGLCLLNAILICINFDRPEPMSLLLLQSKILSEINTNLESYTPRYCLMEDAFDINQDIALYLDSKIYNTALCDIIPLILANAFKCDLVIHCTGYEIQINPDPIFHAASLPSERPIFHLLKRGEHYDALIPAPVSQ